MANRFWRCPLCAVGQNGSENMRKNDVKRFCLLCSKETGYLVERTCPALEKVRDRKSKQRSEAAKRKRANVTKAKEKRAATNAAKRIVDGVDLDAEARHIWKVLLKTDGARPRRRELPNIDIIQGSSATTSGHAWGHAHCVCVTLTKDRDLMDAIEVLAHELAHIATPGRHHDEVFRCVFVDAVNAAYGVTVKPGVAQYDTDPLVLAALQENKLEIANRRGWRLGGES